MSRTVDWSSKLLGRTRRRRITAIAVILTVSVALGLAYAEVAGTGGALLALTAAGVAFICLLLAWKPKPRPPWDRAGWRSPHELGEPPACAVCGFPCLGGFYVEVPFEPGVYVHTISCGPAFGWVERIAEPTHERDGDGTYRRIDVAGA